MDMFEPFVDWDVTAIIVSLAFVGLLYAFMFKDVFGAGFEALSVWSRLVTMVLSFPIFYLVAWNMLDQ